MQIGSVNNFNVCSPRKVLANNTSSTAAQNPAAKQDLSFCGNDDRRNNKMMKAMRDTGVALAFLLPAASMTTGLSSCDRDDYGYVRADAHAIGGPGSIIDTTICIHPTDTIIKWYYDFKRPIPLDTLYNNFQNWDIDGTDGDKDDPNSNRNIIHYECVRDWEYGTKEIGDINLTESNDPNILIYDTELKDYKGNHLSYGKKIIRIPSGNYTITKADGTVLNSPKGTFVEEYENENDIKGQSVFDCTLKSRAFASTQGDTLVVSKRNGSNSYVETGKAAKGYLESNSILLRNLIGEYPTDDHYIGVKIETVDDEHLRAMYVYAMDKKKED